MIASKYFKVILGIFLSIAIIFTMLITFIPRKSMENQKVSKEYETKVFDKSKVMTINISMDKTSWNEMLENALDEEYYKCDIIINGETFKNVGIRPKGNTTLSQVANDPTTDRYSFKIKFDKYVEGQTCYGLDKMVINNMMSDTTYMKEYLSYDLMNYIGVDTPLYTYSNVSVNGEKWGLYLAIETLEESFAERTYGDEYGQLYKPESMNMAGKNKNMGKDMPKDNGGMPQDMKPQGNGEPPQGMDPRNNENASDNTEGAVNGEKPERNEESHSDIPNNENRMGPGGGDSGGSDLVYKDDNISSYSNIFDSAVFDVTNSDKSRVIKALKNLNEGTNIETYVDVDKVLRYFAANTMLVNLDSYVSNLKHNYYLYEKDGKISILPWDFNLSFAGFQSGSSNSAVNFPIDTPVTGVDIKERPLIGKLLEVDEYKERYYDYLQTLVDGYFSSGLFETKVEEINTLIKDYVKNDATAFYTYEEYEKSIPVFKEFMALRTKSVKGQIEGSIPASTSEQSKSSDKLIDASNIDLKVLGSQGMGENAKGDFKNNTDIETDKGQNKNLEQDDKNDMKKVQDNFKNESKVNRIEIFQGLAWIGILILAFIFSIRFKRKKYK